MFDFTFSIIFFLVGSLPYGLPREAVPHRTWKVEAMRKRIILLNEMWKLTEKLQFDGEFEKIIRQTQSNLEDKKENNEQKNLTKESNEIIKEIHEYKKDFFENNYYSGNIKENPIINEMTIDTSSKTEQLDENELRRKRTLEALERRGILEEK